MEPTNEQNSNIFRTIILNETAQHIIKESISLIDSELSGLRKKTSSTEFQQTQKKPYVKPKSIYIPKPFFKTLKNDYPPQNEDTVTRMGFKETNLSDDFNSMKSKLNGPEIVKLILSVVGCYQKVTLTKLKDRRESLINMLAMKRDPDQSLLHRASLLQNLNEIEEELKRTNFILPTEIPKQFVTCLVNKSKAHVNSPQATSADATLNKFVTTNKVKSRLSLREWISILNNAQSVLTDSDWSYISNHVMSGLKSPVYYRLYWIHKIRPNLKRGLWTENELTMLASLVSELGSKGHWKEIADRMDTNRTAFNCYRTWNNVINTSNPRKSIWSKEEDANLLRIVTNEVAKFPPSLIDWKVVGAFHPSKNYKACKERAHEICQELQPLSMGAGGDFSPGEDLALLLSVQRRGVGGGKYGRGTGMGVGSWAVIATDMPGRMAADCEQRYITLCEQFQPWSHTEDRKLFQCAVKIKKMQTTNAKDNHKLYARVSPDYLPYFPGRSTAAIKSRMDDLLQFTKVFRRLRFATSLKKLEAKENVTVIHDEEIMNPTEIRELKSILFKSSILTRFINDLRANGIADPEERSFEIICAWSPSKSEETLKSLQQMQSCDTENDDFLGFLVDLETGALLSSTTITPFTTTTTTTTTTSTSMLNTSSGTHANSQEEEIKPLLAPIKLNTLTGKQTKRLLQISQVKCVLLPDLRESIKRHATGIARVSNNKTFNETNNQNSVQAHERPRRIPSRSKESVSSMEYTQAANHLLQNENIFWSILDEVFKQLGAVTIVNDYNHLCNLEPLIDEMAHEMLLIVMDRIPFVSGSGASEANKPDGKDKTNEKTTEKETQVENREEGNKTKAAERCLTFSEIGIVYRRKLLRLHQLLRASRIIGNKSRMEYFYPVEPRYFSTNRKLVNPKLRKFPLLSHLPALQAEQFLQSPETWIRDITRLTANRAAIYLDAPQKASKSHPITNSEQNLTVSLQPKLIRVMPPNDGTMLAFKSLLLRLPSLFNHGNNFINKHLMTRRLLGYFEDTNIGSVSIPFDAIFKETLAMSPNRLLMIGNPKQSNFVARCISIFLWPCILANLPAKGLVDSAIRAVQEAKMTLPVIADPIKRVCLPNRIKRKFKDLDDWSGHNGTKVKRPKIDKKKSYSEMLKEGWMTLTVEFEGGAKADVHLPISVEDLLESGFKPVKFLTSLDFTKPAL